MRPTVPELLKGIKYNLDAIILPDLSSPWPKMTVMQMSRLIDHLMLRWEGEEAFLRHDNQRLRTMLNRILMTITDVPSPHASLQQVITETLQQDFRQEGSSTLLKLSAENRALRQAMEATVQSLDTEEHLELHQELRACLREQLTEELELVQPLLSR